MPIDNSDVLNRQMTLLQFCFAAALIVAVFFCAGSEVLAQDESRAIAEKNLRPAVSKMELNLESESIHDWDRYVRGFRREHQFAMVAGYSSGVWELYRFGTLEDVRVAEKGAFAKFQYSFHLPIYSGFGYLLGSSFGTLYESSRPNSKFKSAPSVMLPGVLAGFVLNISPAFRCTVAGEIYLERFDGIQDRDNVGSDDSIHITTETFDGSVGIDWFYSLKWALRIEGHLRRLVYVRPQEPDGKPVDANIKKRDEWVGAGVVHHFL